MRRIRITTESCCLGLNARTVAFSLFVLVLAAASVSAQEYAWPRERSDDAGNTIQERIKPPAGYERLGADSSSFAAWLRGLPLRQGNPDVLLYNGRKKSRQDTHHAILDIDIGTRDLQQCADACIRLFAEYAYSQGRYNDIVFNFTSGNACRYADWRTGKIPPDIRQWVKDVWPKSPDTTYDGFRKYLDVVFVYAGSVSLERECARVTSADSLAAGDMLMRPGFPGHVCMIIDVAVDTASGTRACLLFEGFTPAQNLVILRHPDNPGLSPWYVFDCDAGITTPDWSFDCGDFRRPEIVDRWNDK